MVWTRKRKQRDRDGERWLAAMHSHKCLLYLLHVHHRQLIVVTLNPLHTLGDQALKRRESSA
jgi:hypothetical protein